MTLHRDHGIILIRTALACAARMDVDIGNNRHIMRSAVGPEVAKVAAIETNDPRVEAVRIEVVVQDIVDNLPPAICDDT